MPDQLRQGPATFALPGEDSAVPTAAVPQLGTPQVQAAQLVPGLTTQAPGVDDADAKTYRVIADLASGILAPKIKQAAQAQMVQGVQQAMTGEGLDDIIKSKPWYTDIFAPSSALVGARTFTAQRAVAEWAGKMQEQMPRLAQQGPEDLQKAATDALTGFMTGDANTDAMMTSAVVEQMAPLFKQHAKEHYVFVQKQATAQQIGTWEALGRVYQGVAASAASGQGVTTPEDHEAAKSRLLGAIAPFADQSDESFERNIGAFLEGSASAGNFQVVKLFKDTGLYDKISPDKRATLDRNLAVFGKQALNKATPQFAVEIASLVNDTTQDPKSLPAKVAALNAKAAALTGVSEAELIPSGSLDTIVGSIMVAQRNEADARVKAAQSAAEKDAEKAGEVAKAATLLQGAPPGTVDACVTFGLCKEAAVEQAGALAYAAAKTPEERAKVLNARTTKAFEGIKASYSASLRTPEFQKGIGDIAQVYQGLAEDVKTRYFNEQERALMDRFNSLVRGGTPPAAAWIVSKATPLIADNAVPQEAHDAISKTIRSTVESSNESGVLHINTLDDASMRLAEAMTMRTYKLDRTNNPPDVAAQRAYAEARANGLDIQGKHAIINTDPKAPPLARVIGESVEGTARAFEELMAEHGKKLGTELKDYMIVRTPDRGGKAYYQVSAYNDLGVAAPFTITSDEVAARVVERVRKQMEHAAGAAPTAPVIGPGGAAFGLVPRP